MTTRETRGFQAEVRQLLRLMIHSLYSHREIFLRELISNASDANDKLRFLALAEPALLADEPELAIWIDFDKSAGTISIRDNGVGMSREEAISHLGTIAKSGTSEFFQRLTGDQDVRKLILGLGADKGLHGIALFTSQPSQIISKAAVRHLDDLKGKKIRIFGSQLQLEGFQRLGLTPVALSLGDVLPALQQGAIDGAVAGTVIYSAMHYQDAAKYVTDIGQPVAFGIATVNKKWYDALPPDLQKIIDDDAAKANDRLLRFLGGYYAPQPPEVIRQRQACYAGPVSGVAEYLAAYAQAGVTHFCVRFAGEHESHMTALAKARVSLGW